MENAVQVIGHADKENSVSNNCKKMEAGVLKSFGTHVHPNQSPVTPSRDSGLQTPGRVTTQYKQMVADLQSMVSEVEEENKDLSTANADLQQKQVDLQNKLINEQEDKKQYLSEYERIQSEGCDLYKKYEIKTKKCVQSLTRI